MQDALQLVQSLRGEQIDLVFLDPPFNLRKAYDVDGRGSLEDLDESSYEEYLNALLIECIRVMREGASLFLFHLPKWATRFSGLLNRHLEFRHWIALSINNGFARGERLYPAHYALLYYSNGTPATFNRPRDEPQRCRHCGEYVRDYGGYKSIIDNQGVNLSDVWTDIVPIRHASKKHRPANQLPQLITDRVVSISGTKGGTLLDPFVGTGTSLISARANDMRFVAGDLSPEAIAVTTKRLRAGA